MIIPQEITQRRPETKLNNQEELNRRVGHRCKAEDKMGLIKDRREETELNISADQRKTKLTE